MNKDRMFSIQKNVSFVLRPVAGEIIPVFLVIIKSCLWWFLQLSGIRLIWYKIHPPSTRLGVQPSSFIFWLLSVYILLFSVASIRYEGYLSLLEGRVGIYISRYLVTNNNEEGSLMIPDLVRIQRQYCPVEPVLLAPSTTFDSLFFFERAPASLFLAATNKKQRCYGISEMVREIIASRKISQLNLKNADLWGASFARVNFSKANLSHSNLYNVDFSGATLHFADISGASLKKAVLRGANLQVASFKNTNLEGADLEGANLSNAFFWGANFKGANLRGVNLEGAYLKNAKNLTVHQLAGAGTLVNAQLDEELDEKLRKNYPALFSPSKYK